MSASGIAKAVTVQEWMAMSHRQKAALTSRVFGCPGNLNLGQGYRIIQRLCAEGFAIEFTDPKGDSGIYCMLQLRGDNLEVGWGPTITEAVAAAGLKYTQFLLDDPKPNT